MNPQPRTWKPKPKPSWRSRIFHAIGSVLAIQIGQAVWGYSGAAWACVGVLIFGCAWEIGTPWVARRAGLDWPHGDLSELASYAFGAGVGVVLAWLIFGC